MRRFHSEAALFERRQKFAAHYYTSRNQLGRWRKRNPLDCGRVRCGICHGDKFYAPKARHNNKLAAIQYELDAERKENT